MKFTFFQPATIAVTAITAVLWISKAVAVIKKRREEPKASSVAAFMELLQSILTSGAIVAASTITENAISNRNNISNLFNLVVKIANSSESLTTDFANSSGSLTTDYGELRDQVSALHNVSSESHDALRADSEKMTVQVTALRDAFSESDDAFRADSEELKAGVTALQDATERVLQTTSAINDDQMTIAADIAHNTASLVDISRQLESLKRHTAFAPLSLLPSGTLPLAFQMAGMTFVVHEGSGEIGHIDGLKGYKFIGKYGLTIIMPTIGSIKHVDLTVCIEADPTTGEVDLMTGKAKVDPMTGEAIGKSGEILATRNTPSNRGCHTIYFFEDGGISAVRLKGNSAVVITQVLAKGERF